jgi:hypothetical protein
VVNLVPLRLEVEIMSEGLSTFLGSDRSAGDGHLKLSPSLLGDFEWRLVDDLK